MRNRPQKYSCFTKIQRFRQNLFFQKVFHSPTAFFQNLWKTLLIMWKTLQYQAFLKVFFLVAMENFSKMLVKRFLKSFHFLRFAQKLLPLYQAKAQEISETIHSPKARKYFYENQSHFVRFFKKIEVFRVNFASKMPLSRKRVLSQTASTNTFEANRNFCLLLSFSSHMIFCNLIDLLFLV